MDTSWTVFRERLANVGAGLVLISVGLVFLLAPHEMATDHSFGTGSFLVASSSAARPIVTTPRTQDSIRGRHAVPLAGARPTNDGTVGLGSPKLGQLKIQAGRRSVSAGGLKSDANDKPQAPEVKGMFQNQALYQEFYEILVQWLTVPLLGGVLAYLMRPRSAKPLKGGLDTLGVRPFALMAINELEDDFAAWEELEMERVAALKEGISRKPSFGDLSEAEANCGEKVKEAFIKDDGSIMKSVDAPQKAAAVAAPPAPAPAPVAAAQTATNLGSGSHQDPEKGLKDKQWVDRKYVTEEDDGNKDLEYSRYFRRTVYDHSDWRDARSPIRKAQELGNLFGSRIIRNALKEVAYVTAIATFVAIADQYIQDFKFFTFPLFPFTLSATSLGALLTYRTNTSYKRFVEVRIKWAVLTSRTRDLARETLAWFPNDAALKRQMGRMLMAWPYVLKCHLRGGPGGFEDDNDIKEALSHVLTPLEVETLLSSGHRPKHMLSNITFLCHEADLGEQRLQEIDNNLTVFEDVLGGCERLLRTPIPLPYTRLASRFLSLWLTALPFAILTELHKSGINTWAMVPSVAFIALLLLSIEEVAIQLEEPFSILPFDSIADEVKNDIKALQRSAEGRNATLTKTRRYSLESV